MRILVKILLTTILSFLMLIGCDNSTEPKKEIEVDYFEDFEETIIFDTPIQNDDSSFISYGSNDWICYYEKSYEEYHVSTSWKWEKVDNSNSGYYGIRGTTSVEGMGGFWLLKSYEIREDALLNISVYARTEKIHNGSVTGPSLYVFEGEIFNPSVDHSSLMGRDYYEWDYSFWSDWKKLDTGVETNLNFITVGLYVRDGWNRYGIYHEFDNLRVTLE